MKTRSLFEAEEQVIKSAKVVIEDEKYVESPLKKEYLDLFEHYQKLSHHFSMVVRIGDKQQVQLRKSQKIILEKNKELELLSATKDRFFSIIAHDLKSPFNGLLGLSDVFYHELETLDHDDLVRISKGVYGASRNVYRLLENLLEWAKTQTGGMQNVPIAFSMKNFIDEVVSLYKANTMKKNLNIVNEVPLECTAYADPNLFSTIFRNLFSNAVKFTPKEGSIFFTVEETEDFFQLCIRDTGIGFKENSLKKLFKIDEKFSTKGTDGEPGTGLGLVLCKELIQLIGGKIWVESEMNKGANFYFTIPRAKSMDQKQFSFQEEELIEKMKE